MSFETSASNVADTLDIIVNGKLGETCARSLADLVEDRVSGDARVATALNGSFVPVGKRSTTLLSPGDSVEILSARQGG